MGSEISTQDKITIGSLAASVVVTAIILTVTICQFVRYRRNEKKKLDEEQKIKDRRGLQWRSREVPYRLGEDVMPSMYPDYPDYPPPVDIVDVVDVVDEYPVDYPVDYPEPRARFFPVDDRPYPMRPCIEPPRICDCEPEPQPDQRVIFEPVGPPPAPPPPEPQPIIVYQPLPRDPVPQPPPPPREVIREIYFPAPAQPQPPPPPRERRGSWCGPSHDDWVLVKKEVTRKKPKKVIRVIDDSDDESSSSSSSEEEGPSPYNRRLMPYDLAMPRMQFPQPQMQMPAPPSIYFIPQQPAPAPAPVPPPPAPAPAPPAPAPAPRGNAFFAANVRRFDSRQYEEQEQRANVATESYDCDDCNF